MDAPPWLGVACMFLNGFIMLTPHRIAMLCANHVIKRFHLPPATVPLFIYKIHNPMELSSLTSTFIAFTVSWIADAAFTNDTTKKKFQRIISCITMWFMFLATLISYFMFISGDDYGNFDLFYWSVVSITFANGMASNFGFGVNFNATMYGAGIPASSFVTFIVHNTYKYFYNIYFWDDYDYRLVVLQYWVTIFFIALTDALWTWDQMNQMGGGGWGGGGFGVEIDISQAPVTGNADGGKYMSGGITIKVEKKDPPNNGSPNTWVGYKHSNSASGGTFTPNKIMHSDQEMGGDLTNSMNKQINTNGGIYVYYKDSGANLNNPKVICISTDGETSNNKWYKAGDSADSWTEVTGNAINSKNPNDSTGENPVTASELDGAIGKSTGFTPQGGTDYVIKLDKRPLTEGDSNKINYRTKDKDIEVEKKDSGDNKVPENYKAYIHSPNGGITGKIILQHNGFTLKEVNETNVSKIFVYYSNSDTEHEFPLIVCVYKGSTPKYYKRGNEWNVEPNLSTINPENPNSPNPAGLTTLGGKLGEVEGKFEVKLDKISKYKGSPQSGAADINVAPEDVGKFKGYHHSYATGSMTINRITHKGTSIRGVKELDKNNNIDIEVNKKVWVFYEVKDGTPKLDKPLLLYFKNGTGGTGTNNWYGRGKKWEEHTDMSTVDVSTGLNANEAAIKYKLNAILNRQGKFLELVCFDNITHWSPILMLSFSLGTIYAFYPSISPYELIDPERAEKIDLWIVAICAIPNLFLAILDLELPSGPVGPGKKWIEYQQDYNPWEPRDTFKVNRDWYHYVWLIGGIPYLICLHVFISTLHFPDGWIGRHVKDNSYVVGFFSVVFNTVQELMESVAFGGGAVQSHDGFVGSINQFNVLLMLTTCVCTMFPCDGYLKTLINSKYSYIIFIFTT